MRIPQLIAVAAIMAVSASWAGGEDVDPRVQAAREQLARRLNVPVARVELVSQTEMTWPDSRMGCQRVGVKYEDILTQGSQLVFNVAGQTHFYHARKDAPYEYCVTPNTKRTGPVKAPIR